MKLIELKLGHFIVVDNSEIKEGDCFWIIGGHPVDYGIRICHWISKNRACWSEKNKNWISETCDMLYIDKYEDGGWGFVERHKALKIIYSTYLLEGMHVGVNLINNNCDRFKF